MLTAPKLNLPTTPIPKRTSNSPLPLRGRRISLLRLGPPSRLIIYSAAQSNCGAPQTAPATSEPSISSSQEEYISAVGSPSLHISKWNLTQRHILALNVIACSTAISATWLFFSAIPTILAFKRAAESLEKLMDVAREELPDTMAAVRLSGMEISDLTMELSDLGQELTQGVKRSTRAIHLAEDKLQQLANMTSPVPVQAIATERTKRTAPALAASAKSMREGIMKNRALLKSFFSLIQFSSLASKYVRSRSKQ